MFTLGQDQKITLSGGAGDIEAISTTPTSLQQSAIAIICHPHSLHGGSMNNKVVTTVVRACRDAGIRALRFNFRGVGHSQGEFDDGVGESEDLLQIMQTITQQQGEVPIYLFGFSFGSYVSYRAALQRAPHLLISIAPAVTNFDFDSKQPDCPWVVIFPEADEVVEPAAVEAWYQQLSPQPQLIRYPDTSHFFHGKLIELKATITSCMAPNSDI